MAESAVGAKPGAARGERLAVLLSALAFFCILSSYFIIRPVRDQLSGAVGSSALPLFYAGTFIGTLLVAPLFGWLVSRYSRRWLLVASYSFFILCLLAFVPAFMAQQQIGARNLGVVFFIWTSVFNLFVVSLFWSLMADLFTSEQSQRWFPLIGIGGTVGAVFGPILTTSMVGVVGVAPLLLISALILAIALGLLLWLALRHSAGRAPMPPIGGSILDGVRQVFAQPFIRWMAVLMLLSDGIGTVAYALLADYAKAHLADAVLRTAFYGRLDLAANLLVIVFQLGFTRWMLVRHGAGLTLALAEACNVLLFVLLGCFAATTLQLPWIDWHGFSFVVIVMPLIGLVTIGTRALAYGVIVPASNTLYTRAPRDARYKGKNFVDTAVWRFGDLVVTTGLNGLRALGAGMPVLAGISATAAACAGVVGWRASRSSDLAPADADQRNGTAVRD